jgi:hypothetical protein
MQFIIPTKVGMMMQTYAFDFLVTRRKLSYPFFTSSVATFSSSGSITPVSK